MTPDERTTLEGRIHHAICFDAIGKGQSWLVARQIVDLIEQRDSERDEELGRALDDLEKAQGVNWEWLAVVTALGAEVDQLRAERAAS